MEYAHDHDDGINANVITMRLDMTLTTNTTR